MLLGTETIGLLAPLTDATGSVNISLPELEDLPAGFPGAGTYTILMVSDHQDAVAESDEADNAGRGEGVDTITIDVDVQQGSVFGNAFAFGSDSPSADERGDAVGTDSEGNVYVIGTLLGMADVDPGAGEYLFNASGRDGFLIKYSPGGALLWATLVSDGGNGGDGAHDVAVDADGNAYVVYSAFQSTSVSKYDSDGQRIWDEPLGGSGFRVGRSIGIDAAGNAYVAGMTKNPSSSNDMNIFAAKVDAAGNLAWMREIGNLTDDEGLGIAVDAAGNVYATGYFTNEVDFDPGPGTLILGGTSGGVLDAFFWHLDTDGNLVWASTIDGTTGIDIALDPAGNIYATGVWKVGSIDLDPGPGVFQVTHTGSSGSDDIWVLKLDNTGAFVWGDRIGSSQDDEVRSLHVDAAGNIYTTGRFEGTVDFDPGSGQYLVTSNGGQYDIFVSMLDTAGEFVWAGNFGGTTDTFSRLEAGEGVTTADDGTFYATGYFRNPGDFDPTARVFNVTAPTVGTEDVFLLKLNAPSTIAGRTWFDSDADGVQDGGEPTTTGAVVQLFDTVDGIAGNGDDVLESQTTSDANGYSFTTVIVGTFYVQFDQPLGLTYTAGNQGGDDEVDSDADAVLGRTPPIALTPGTVAASVDAGYVPQSSGPQAVADAYVTDEDAPLAVVAAQGVLANDTGGTLSAVLITGAAHGQLTLYADGSFDYTSNPQYNGPDAFTYKAFDGAIASLETTVTTGIAAVNVIEDAGDVQIALFDAFEDVEDADVDLLFTVEANDNAALFVSVSILPVTGVLTLDFAPNAFGHAMLTVRATDTGGLFEEASFTDDVDPENDVPTTSGISDLAAPRNAPDAVIGLFDAFDDLEDADADLVFTIEANTNAALFDGISIDPPTGELTLEFAPDISGLAQVTVRATDMGGLFVQSSFIVVVNDTPTMTGIADVVVDEDAADSVINLFAAFDDTEDSDTDLAYTLVSNSNPGLFAAAAVDAVAGTLTLDFAANAFGVADLVVRAVDTLGLTVEAAFTATVNPQNDQPTSTGLAPVGVLEGAGNVVSDLFAVFDDVEDADTDLVLSIEDNDNPGLVSTSLHDPVVGQLTLVLTPDASGVAVITIRATDLDGAFIEDTLTVNVTPGAEIRGVVWIDSNNNAVDDGELRQANVEVYLDLNENGSLDAGEPVTTTAFDGSYAFTGLAAGSYIVAETVPSGHLQTWPGQPGAPAQLFTIDLLFDGNLSGSQRQIIADAAERWMQAIVGDVPGIITDIGLVDDIAVDVRGVSIDGAGNTAAQSAQSQLRPGSFLPARGVLELDLDDVAALEADGRLFTVVLHELAHLLGFGTIWNQLGLLADGGGPDPQFIGAQAVAEYAALTGSAEVSVPVANTGGAGTVDRHWRESVFDDELMTGALDPSVNPLSRITIAAMADLGYVVDINAADLYTLPGGGSSGGGSMQADPPLPQTHRVVLAEGEAAEQVNFGNAPLSSVVFPPQIASISPAPGTLITQTSVDIVVTFDEPVFGVEAGDLVLTGSAAANAAVGTPVDIGNNTWVFPVTDLAGGSLTLTLASDAGDVEDADGNSLDTAAWSYAILGNFNLDVDNNGVIDALTDGVLIIRHLFGFTGNSLIDGALAPDALRTDPQAIADLLNQGMGTMLDADDNGAADALSDGIIIVRYVFGFTGQTLIDDALEAGASRVDPVAIAAFLAGYLPTAPQQEASVLIQPDEGDAGPDRFSPPAALAALQLQPTTQAMSAAAWEFVTFPVIPVADVTSATTWTHRSAWSSRPHGKDRSWPPDPTFDGPPSD